MTAPFLRFESVRRAYGNHATALEDITLDVTKGEIVFLTGPSGAGKTTLMKMLWAEGRPDSGDVYVEGRSLRRLAAESVPFLRRNIGIIFQDFRLLQRRTVADNVALPLEVLGLPAARIRPRVLEMLARVGLTGLGRRLPGQLSAGEQQRVAVARALVHRPSLVLADEPTGNVDHELRDILMDLLVELAVAEGATVLIATHDRELVQVRGFREVRLHGGRIVEDRPERRGPIPFPVDWSKPAMPPSIAPPRQEPVDAEEAAARERARIAREAAAELLARSPLADAPATSVRVDARPATRPAAPAPAPANIPAAHRAEVEDVPRPPTTDEIEGERAPIVFAVVPVPAIDDSVRTQVAAPEPTAPSGVTAPASHDGVGVDTEGTSSVRKRRKPRTERPEAGAEKREKPSKRMAPRNKAPRS